MKKKKKIWGADYGESVDFVLIRLGLSAAKSMFFGRNQPIKISLGVIARMFFFYYEQIYVYAAVFKIS